MQAALGPWGRPERQSPASIAGELLSVSGRHVTIQTPDAEEHLLCLISIPMIQMDKVLELTAAWRIKLL